MRTFFNNYFKATSHHTFIKENERNTYRPEKRV